MDFSKYRTTDRFHVTRIRRTDMAIARTVLSMSGDPGFSVEAWSRRLPEDITSQLPEGTDRRHGIVRSHYGPDVILAMLEDARRDADVQAVLESRDNDLQKDYRENYKWLDGHVPVSDTASGA